ncbi:MAG: NADH-quinone oxidoreductase subunit L [Firmicutes bacterium]|nr:NADH-quinone oxidoreductase subunit L [Bacillota bacterium]
MENALLVAILAPILGAFTLPLLGMHSAKARNAVAAALLFLSFGASLLLLKPSLSGDIVTVFKPAGFGLDLIFSADALGVFMALAATLIGLIVTFYSFDYLRREANQNEYYFLTVLFLGAMAGLVYSQNLVIIYLFWEISAVVCWRLIGFYREPFMVRRADKAFLITVGGALAMLLGLIILFNEYHSFDLRVLRGMTAPNLAVGLIMAGIFSKSATLPFHTWLPDAGVAPSPVTALLHAAVLVKIGVFVFARLFVGGLVWEPVWDQVLPVVIGISSIVAGGAALVENDLKRIIAYSTVSQLAFIFLGLLMDSRLAVAGGLLYILTHGLAKGGLFLCAGIVEHKLGAKDIRQMGGLARNMPITASAFAFCALSVMGIPPCGGFFSKYMVIAGAVESGKPWLAGVFIAGAFLTVLYLLRLFAKVFLGEPKFPEVKEGTAGMLWAVSVLAGLSLLSGFLIGYPNEFIQIAVGRMVGIE